MSHTEKKKYRISALVPTYNAGRFMRGLLEDLEAQTIADELEIVIVDTASPGHEGEVVREFQEQYDNIVYIRTEHKENSHEATLRAMKAATGTYFTLACTDDRHKRDAFERMAAVLDARPDVALVYANVYITTVENETFDSFTKAGRYRWFDFDPWKLLYCCFMGPQPMWRRSLHHRYGYFDGSLESAGDWEFWLRMAGHETFLHIDEYLGLYLYSPTSSEHKNPELSRREAEQVHRKYIHRETALRTAHRQALALMARSGLIPAEKLPPPGTPVMVNLNQFEPTPFHRNWLVQIIRGDESSGDVEAAVQHVREWLEPTADVALQLVDAVTNPPGEIHVSPPMLTLARAVERGVQWEADFMLFMTAACRFTAQDMKQLYHIMQQSPEFIAIYPVGNHDSLRWLCLSAHTLRQHGPMEAPPIVSLVELLEWVQQYGELSASENDGMRIIHDGSNKTLRQYMEDDVLLLKLLSGVMTPDEAEAMIGVLERWIEQRRYVEAEVALQRMIDLNLSIEDHANRLLVLIRKQTVAVPVN